MTKVHQELKKNNPLAAMWSQTTHHPETSSNQVNKGDEGHFRQKEPHMEKQRGTKVQKPQILLVKTDSPRTQQIQRKQEPSDPWEETRSPEVTLSSPRCA